MSKTCQICGDPSGMYPLCREHNELKKKELVIKNKKTDKWELVEEKQNNKPKNTGSCIVCGEDAPNGMQCKECYLESIDFKDQIDKNMNRSELSGYYYNSRDSLYRMRNFVTIKRNCNKLIAIAAVAKELHKNDSLISKVQVDVEKVIENKKDIKVKTAPEIIKKQDAKQERNLDTLDGHFVKSQGEQIVDDLLYSNGILHCYSPKVVEVNSKEEPAMVADWFIPIINSSKGVYIEYWGMKTADYLRNKKRKQESYKKNNIALIEIEKEEPSKDSRTLITRIRSELNNIAKERYKLHDNKF